jgi:NADPH-dependent glutamate synthase beta subunit-like oxidoreductase
MSEAEFERRQAQDSADSAVIPMSQTGAETETAPRVHSPTKTRSSRAKPAKSRRVQRMFAIEEEVDKKLWLYAIHMGKDRSEVVNDLLRPLVASMVLYDSRDRRNAGRVVEVEGQGSEAAEG